jgi:hypothetical protein
MKVNLEANSFNVFDFLKTVRNEIIASSSLAALGTINSFIIIITTIIIIVILSTGLGPDAEKSVRRLAMGLGTIKLLIITSIYIITSTSVATTTTTTTTTTTITITISVITIMIITNNNTKTRIRGEGW